MKCFNHSFLALQESFKHFFLAFSDSRSPVLSSLCAIPYRALRENSKYGREHNSRESFALNSSTMSFQAIVSTHSTAFIHYILAHSKQLTTSFVLQFRHFPKACSISGSITKCPEKCRKSYIFYFS